MLQGQRGTQANQAAANDCDITHSTRHQGFNFDNLARQRVSQNLATLRCDENIVFDTNSDIPPLAMDPTAMRWNVDSRLDCYYYVWFE